MDTTKKTLTKVKKWTPWPNFSWKTELITLFTLLITCSVQALLLSGVYRPTDIVSGGATGIAMLIEYTVGIPTWISNIALNIPIMICGLKFLNLRLVFYSSLAMLTFSFVLGLTPDFVIPIEDPLIAAIFGGAIMGAMGAPIIRQGASMGGLDVVALILNKQFSFSLGSINIALNLLIISSMGFLAGLEAALLSLITMFIYNVSFDNFNRGMNRTKTVFIISDYWKQIAPAVSKKLHRGATYLHGTGAYTGDDKTIVYCIVRTVELAALRRIVREYDPNAIFSIIDTREVIGRGFSTMH